MEKNEVLTSSCSAQFLRPVACKVGWRLSLRDDRCLNCCSASFVTGVLTFRLGQTIVCSSETGSHVPDLTGEFSLVQQALELALPGALDREFESNLSATNSEIKNEIEILTGKYWLKSYRDLGRKGESLS